MTVLERANVIGTADVAQVLPTLGGLVAPDLECMTHYW